jgi:peptide/nickel transport system permease protein
MSTPLFPHAAADLSTAQRRAAPSWRTTLRRVLREPRVLFGAFVLCAIVFAAVAAPWIAPFRPDDQDLLSTLLPPAWMPGGAREHWLGTDSLGRDVLSLALYGSRIAVLVGGVAPVGTALLGGALALVAGWCGGKVDWFVLRVVEVWMSFPAVVLALVLVVALSPSETNVIIALIFVDWTRFCRVLRAEIVVIRRRDYVAAARIAGASPLAIVMRDVLPGVMPALITLMSLEVGIAIVAECSLSFIGLTGNAANPGWGGMIADGLANVFTAPWGLILPIACMVLTVVATTFLGEGLRRTTDSRLAEREEATS